MEWVRWTTMPCPRLLYLKARCISRSRSSTATPVSKRIYQLTEEVIGFPRVVEPLGDIFAQRRWGFGKNGEHADVELRRRARDAGRAGPGRAGPGWSVDRCCRVDVDCCPRSVRASISRR